MIIKYKYILNENEKEINIKQFLINKKKNVSLRRFESCRLRQRSVRSIRKDKFLIEKHDRLQGSAYFYKTFQYLFDGRRPI